MAPCDSRERARIRAIVRDHLAVVEQRNTEKVNQVADLFLDCVRANGLVFPAGAGHSLAAVAETFYRALARLVDKAPVDAVGLPLWRGSNVPGGDEANVALFQRYAERISNLA